jgi:carbon storage regulator
MLVLSRKRGEQIRVPGCDLIVTVVSLSDGRVRLGFSAPDDVAIFREEVWGRVKDQAEAAGRVLGGQSGPELASASETRRLAEAI